MLCAGEGGQKTGGVADPHRSPVLPKLFLQAGPRRLSEADVNMKEAVLAALKELVLPELAVLKQE